VGKINDFTIKLMEQYSYLLTGFSRHNSSRPMFGGTTLSTTTEAGRDHVGVTRTRPPEGRAVDVGTPVWQRSEPSSSDSDPESGSDDDGCSSEDELGCSGARMNIPWGPVDEQRLLAYKKEGKSWDWIFKKFPGRTPAAVRTRWTIVQRRVEYAS
jgi:hypothetical protein